jgi:hypothetical protein
MLGWFLGQAGVPFQLGPDQAHSANSKEIKAL